MKCTDYRPMQSGSLRGFATLELANGLGLVDCTHHMAGDGEWVNPPGKPQLDKEKRPVLKEGKLQYSQVVTFRDKATRDAWSQAAVAAIRHYCEAGR